MSSRELPFRALLFEDEYFVRSSLEAALKLCNYEVVTYSTPAACPLSTSRECPCGEKEVCADVIIVDLHMPRSGGLDFVEGQKKKGCRCRHFALMSSSWSPEETARAEELGCMILRKPFPLVKLTGWLEEAEGDMIPGRTLVDIPPEGEKDT